MISELRAQELEWGMAELGETPTKEAVTEKGFARGPSELLPPGRPEVGVEIACD